MENEEKLGKLHAAKTPLKSCMSAHKRDLMPLGFRNHSGERGWSREAVARLLNVRYARDCICFLWYTKL